MRTYRLVLWFLLCYIAGSEESSRNVAYKKGVVKSCGKPNYTNTTLTDGSLDTFDKLYNFCGYKSIWVNIDLEDHYVIHYVIMRLNKIDVVMGNYMVDLRGDHGKHHCGKSPNRAHLGEMRVNCDAVTSLNSFVNVSSDPKNSMVPGIIVEIKEIEVHTMDFPYFGCYNSIKGYAEVAESNDTNTCVQECYANGYMFAGIQDNICKCGSDLPGIPLPHAKCNCEETEDSGMCEWVDSYSVYIARIPFIHYTGCYRALGRIIVKIHDNITSPIECILVCQSEKVNSIAVAEHAGCVCFRGVLSRRFDESICNTVCEEIGHVACGGREAMAVFSDGLGTSTVKLLNLYHCEDNEINIHGVCQGKCSKGWRGELCMDKDVSGCAENSCNLSSTVCHNKPDGSYECVCISGWKRISLTTCELNEDASKDPPDTRKMPKLFPKASPATTDPKVKVPQRGRGMHPMLNEGLFLLVSLKSVLAYGAV